MKEIRVFSVAETEGVLKSFLHSTLKEIMEVVSADCGSLFLFDPEHKELVLDSFYNSSDLHLKGLRKRIGEGVSGKVVELKAPVLVNNINDDMRFKKNGFAHYRTDSFMSIPLFGSVGLFGLINIADKSNGDVFTDKDLEFAVTLSKFACIVLEYLLHSSRLNSEKETLHKQKSVLEKYASVGKLAAGVVHEINNPLDGIIRYTNMLLEHVESNAVSREYLMEIKKGLGRIANITKSLLEFSHQVNTTAAAKKYSDLHALIDECLDILSAKIKANTRLNKFYDKSLPRIQDFGLQQVFINILKNALDAMPEGGQLDIFTQRRDSAIGVIFKDTGCGIPKEIVDQIFEPFFTTKSIGKGTGLGLSICKEIIAKYEGNIEVESAPGKGSTFKIIIPEKYLENG